VHKQLVKNIDAFKRLAKFGPYVGGDTFTLADCAAWVSLPLVGMATKGVLGTDLLMEAGVDWKAYNKLIAARESAVRINADRKVAQDEMAALSAKK
jgi:glutathione S-transferase